MSRAVIVAVSQRVDIVAGRDEQRDALDQRLIAFLLQSDAVPIPVPNGLFMETSTGQANHQIFDAWLGQVKPHAVVLSGGNDIGECRDRDLTEAALLDYAQKYGLPVLGICRGMQMMGVWAGGHLAKVDGHVRSHHRLQIFDQTAAWPLEVNSYHNWSLTECPEGFVVEARSEDGAIEAIRHAHLPWEGWMWHPEREPVFSAADVGRVRKLFQMRETR